MTSLIKLSKGFTKPTSISNVHPNLDVVVEAHAQLRVKRKLAMMQRSSSGEGISGIARGLVELFTKTGLNKTRCWSVLEIIFSEKTEECSKKLAASGEERLFSGLKKFKIQP